MGREIRYGGGKIPQKVTGDALFREGGNRALVMGF